MSYRSCLELEPQSHEWERVQDGSIWEERPSPGVVHAGPGATYSLRAARLGELRGAIALSAAHWDEDVLAVSPAAGKSAKEFINNLPAGCLEHLRIAISHDGEINFFFGAQPELLQILFDEAGRLSFYGEAGDLVLSGNDVTPPDFRYLELMKFVDRRK